MYEGKFQLAFGDRNVGSLFLPDESSSSLPVLIVCHGWPSDRHLYEFPAELVNRGTEAGMAIVTFDLGLEFFKDFTGGAPIYTMTEIRCPMLFVEGGADNPYRRTDGRLGHELMRRAGLTAAFREIPEGNHGMGNVAQEATAIILDWLRERQVLT